MKRVQIFLSILLLALALPASADDPTSQLVINSAQVDFGIGRIYIAGKNFGSPTAPEVKLNDQMLTVMSFTDGTIDAVLPAGIQPGSYLLHVSRGSSSTQNGVFDVTLGAVGPNGDKGDKGDQGLTGSKGDTGDRGAQGIQGPKGDKGDTGATGPKGNTGDPGEQGTQGPKGDKGDAGATGPQGSNGGAGPQGVKGDTGPAGPQGPKGEDGPAGLGLNPLQVGMLRWYEANTTGTAIDSGAPGPVALAFDGANMWVANFAGLTVTKLRASDGTILGRFYVGFNPSSVVFDGWNVWVAGPGVDSVTKLRGSDGSVLGTFPVGKNPITLVFDGANIWVANEGSASVTKLRASDGTLLGTFAVDLNPEFLAFDGSTVWVGHPSGLTRLRAADGASVGTSHQFSGPFAFDGTYMWARGSLMGKVSKLRTGDATVAAVFTIGDEAFSMCFDGANMWIGTFFGGVTKVRAIDGANLGTFAGASVGALAFDGASVWMTNQGENSVTKF